MAPIGVGLRDEKDLPTLTDLRVRSGLDGESDPESCSSSPLLRENSAISCTSPGIASW